MNQYVLQVPQTTTHRTAGAGRRATRRAVCHLSGAGAAAVVPGRLRGTGCSVWGTGAGAPERGPDLPDRARLEQTRLKGWSQGMAPINREWTAVLNGQRSIGEMIAIAKPEAEAAIAQAQASG